MKNDVLLVNRSQRTAVLTDNSVVPVTHWFDTRGQDCDPEDAVACVAGAEGAGWFSIDLVQFCYATVH